MIQYENLTQKCQAIQEKNTKALKEEENTLATLTKNTFSLQ